LVSVALAAGLFGGVLAGGSVALLAGGDDSAPATPSASSATTLTVQQSSAISDVAAKARPGVVKVESTRRNGASVEHDVGSGIVFDVQGHIITNFHVVEGTESLNVVLADGTRHAAILIGQDYPFTDIAVLQIGPGNLSPIAAGDSSALVLGQAVLAIGNPLSDFEGSVSAGVVSGLNRSRVLDDVKQADLIQTDAAINNGNSGGALLNLQGQFVGIPTLVLRETQSGIPVEGIAFALPSNRVVPIVQRIIADNASYPRPTIAAATQDLGGGPRPPRTAVTEGAYVTAVTPGGGADAAGVEPGDVITKVGTQDVNADTPLLNALMDHQPGETVRVVLNRNGRIIETDVRLGKRS
jgi:S1-C subfamily serine protease